jgi:hypothetical protein
VLHLEPWEVADLHDAGPLAWESLELAYVLSDNAVKSERSAPLSPLGPLWAALQVHPLSPLWPQYRAIDLQDESDAHQYESHCLCHLSLLALLHQRLPELPLPL